jgi:hypothetical protein
MAKQNEMLIGKYLMERKVVDSGLMENFGDLSKYIMNSKIEVKLLFSIERNDVKSSRQKWKKPQVTNLCKVIVTKIEAFDEAMPIVHVHLGKYGVKDVLLDGGSSVNIISKSLRRKLGLKKLQLAPFVVRMVDQRKV